MLTPEDLQQMRAVIREEVAGQIRAVVPALIREEFPALIREEFPALFREAIKEHELVTRKDLDRAMEIVADEFSQVRESLKTLERRTDRIETNINAILMQTAGMSKSLSAAESIDTSFANTLSAQQRAIDELYRQIAELKRQLPPPRHQ